MVPQTHSTTSCSPGKPQEARTESLTYSESPSPEKPQILSAVSISVFVMIISILEGNAFQSLRKPLSQHLSLEV